LSRFFLISTSVIFILFLFFFAFFWLLPHFRNTPVTTNKESQAEPLLLTVNSPNDNEVVSTPTIKIAGRTNSNALIVIYSRDNEEVIAASQEGLFSTDFPLNEKLNEITITSQAENGEEKSIARDIYYLKEEL